MKKRTKKIIGDVLYWVLLPPWVVFFIAFVVLLIYVGYWVLLMAPVISINFIERLLGYEVNFFHPTVKIEIAALATTICFLTVSIIELKKLYWDRTRQNLTCKQGKISRTV